MTMRLLERDAIAEERHRAALRASVNRGPRTTPNLPSCRAALVAVRNAVGTALVDVGARLMGSAQSADAAIVAPTGAIAYRTDVRTDCR